MPLSEHERQMLKLQLVGLVTDYFNELAYQAHKAAVSILEIHGATLRGAIEGPRRKQ